jgi:uncharacterized GH25 family protein
MLATTHEPVKLRGKPPGGRGKLHAASTTHGGVTMSRIFATVLLASVFATSAGAHFVFLLPPTDGKTALMIFADTPVKDEKVETGKVEVKSAQLHTASGKTTTVSVEPQSGGWSVPVANDTAEVRATLEYGVVNRGEGHVIRIRHHGRLVLGDSIDTKPTTPLDIAPVKLSSGTAFKVTFDGKPLAGADVTVHEPGSDQMKVLKTDADGVTPAFAKPGAYSARARHADKTAGELDGRKYAATHSYATLTVVVK